MCGTVITMLPDGKIVRKAVCGEADSFKDCIAATLKPGALMIDMSSSSPVGTRELGALLEKRGIKLIDAPVSNGVKGATAATLAIMVGGDRGRVRADEARCSKNSATRFFTRGRWAGHAIKALNNYVSAAGLVAACEAVVTGQRFGLDPGCHRRHPQCLERHEQHDQKQIQAAHVIRHVRRGIFHRPDGERCAHRARSRARRRALRACWRSRAPISGTRWRRTWGSPPITRKCIVTSRASRNNQGL